MADEKKLAGDTSRDDPQTQVQPPPVEEQAEAETQALSAEELQKENAETSLDQPSEGSS